MKRGDIVTIAVAGDFGKPRPAIIVQNDVLVGIDTVLVAMLTTHDHQVLTFRLRLEPTERNGLKTRSIVMLDKIMVVWRVKCGPVIGSLTESELADIDQILPFVFGLTLTSAEAAR